MKNIIFILLLLFLPSISNAETYWVSPTGAASWASCTGSTPLSGTTACSLSAANKNAVVGDTVYFRDGTYNISGTDGIHPSNSGSAGNPIIFSAYTGETPILTELTTIGYGVNLNGVNYIRITGFKFLNISFYLVHIKGGASYNEIDHNTFTHDVGEESGSQFLYIGNTSYLGTWSTHNWIHHNSFSRRHSGDPCAEGASMVQTGYNGSSPYAADNNNTIEYNYFEYDAHVTFVTYSKYNVVRNNISHNEPWMSGCTSYQGPTYGSPSVSELTIGTGSKTLTIGTGLPGSYWVFPLPVALIYTNDYSKVMFGTITSYNSGDGTLVVNITKTGGSGIYSSWIASVRNVPYYTNASYNGVYGHRNWTIGDSDIYNPNYNLIEGNRIGFGGVNPNNDGAEDLSLESPKNIARYNFLYGAMAGGLFFKSADGEPYNSGGVNNRVYNNTIYYNGIGYDPTLYSGLNSSHFGQGITQYSIHGGNTNNVIKNNIVYKNAQGNICGISWGNPSCTPSAIDTVANNLTTDPSFVNPDLTDPTSQNLFPSIHGYTTTPIPDLRLNSGSSAINGGTYLTQANGGGSNSITLIVDDAMYFQDGSWGSDLSRTAGTMQADWIAIGTVDNVAQIRGINYSTNTITLASPITWADNTPIWLYKKSDGTQVLYGSAPDYGAYEYASTVPSSPDTTPPSPPTGVTVN